MGLDMYFEAKKVNHTAYFKFDENQKPDETNYPEDLKQLSDYILDRNFKSKTIAEYYQIGYFRKFNALHNYIVQNYAEGVDDCREIYLSKSDITNLRDICNKVSEHPDQASTILPTTEGFFFGTTTYDDWYFSDVLNAIELFNLILETIDFNTWEIIYQASW